MIISAYRFPGEQTGVDFAKRVQGGQYGSRPFFVLRTGNIDEVEATYTGEELVKMGVHVLLSRDVFKKQRIEDLERGELAQAIRSMR